MSYKLVYDGDDHYELQHYFHALTGRGTFVADITVDGTVHPVWMHEMRATPVGELLVVSKFDETRPAKGEHDTKYALDPAHMSDIHIY